MAVYVDNVNIKWREREWCHLVADSLEELHLFADSLGLKRAWFQKNASYPHYDITSITRKKAIYLGAQMGDRQKIISCAKKMKAQLEKEINEITRLTNQQFKLF